jgi:predicted RNA-binding protein YlxR (DUF448 family)
MSALQKPEKRKRPRTCVGCGEESPKRELMRVIRTPEGGVRYDPTGRANGRGAYVCRCIDCVRLARKKKAFSKALKAQVEDDVYDMLETICGANSEDI